MPYFQTAFQTKLTSAEVESRLSAITRGRRSFMAALSQGFSGEPERAAFAGSVGAGFFKLHRIIGYRNSFLPVIRGRIEPAVHGSVITLRMHLHPIVAAFMVCWLSFTGVTAFASSTRAIEPVTTIMFAFGLLLIFAAFYPEAVVANRRLRRELAAESPDPPPETPVGVRP